MGCPPRMKGCPPSCGHRCIVTDYRAERQRQEQAAEDDWRARDGDPDAARLVTFQDWLLGLAGRRVRP